MQRTVGFLAIATMAAIMTAGAAAQAPSDPLEACSQMSDPSARLACFDQAMQHRRGTDAPSAAPAGDTPAAPAPPARAPAEPAGGTTPAAAAKHVDDRASAVGLPAHKEPAPEAPSPFVARVTKPVLHPNNLYTFMLDNGQVWEQVDQRTGLFVDPNDTVTISPGVLGSFFLKTSAHQVVRVRRVR